ETMKLNSNWDDPNFVEVKAELKNDITVSHEICTLGSLVITNGATLTIEKGGTVQASVDVLQGCKVIVKDGGKFWTTQGGNIENDDTIIVDKGGEIASMMGGKVINHGTIELYGIFSCGSVRFNGDTGIWFENQGGKVIGDGEAIMSGAYFDKNDPMDMKDCVNKMKTELGPDSKIKISVDPESPSCMDMGDDQGDNGNAGGSVNINLDFNGGEVGMEVDGVYQLFATSDVHNPEMGGKYTVGMMGPLHKDGYKLVGWCENKDGSGKIYKNMEEEITVTGDMTIYAIWEKE
ncbi:MAG: InlB B-repeat-containing protein, partial [Lachnospiraceae bacterium]|nr:InlB B-repeat-containing protein [Lachnospiraceae bacterium]